MVYFAQLSTGAIKIGFSDDVGQRLDQLRTHYGEELSLLHMIDGDRETERAIHKRFSHLRLKSKHHEREQFQPGPELMAFIGKPLLVGQNPNTVEAQTPRRSAKTGNVSLKLDVIQSARIVASCRGESITDLLSDILRPIITKMETEEVAKRYKQRGGK